MIKFVAVSCVLIIGLSGCGQQESEGVGATVTRSAPTDTPGGDGAVVRNPEPTEPAVFATADGLPLSPIAAGTRAYAYHESLFDTAIVLRPHGRPKKIDNPRYKAPPKADGPKYIVMASRGRPTGPTTGVDIVMEEGAQVVAPVTGKVVNASDYMLYCQTPDKRVAIAPDDAPESRVVLFHFETLDVKKGQRVEAGVSELGEPHIFEPHSAQYDSYVAGGLPHIHLEVEDEPTVPTPGCEQKTGKQKGQDDE